MKNILLLFLFISPFILFGQDTITTNNNQEIIVSSFKKCNIYSEDYIISTGICYTTIDGVDGSIIINDIKTVSDNLIGLLFEIQLSNIEYKNNYIGLQYINQGTKIKRNSIYLFIIGLGIISNDYKDRGMLILGTLTSSLSVQLYIVGERKIKKGSKYIDFK